MIHKRIKMKRYNVESNLRGVESIRLLWNKFIECDDYEIKFPWEYEKSKHRFSVRYLLDKLNLDQLRGIQ